MVQLPSDVKLALDSAPKIKEKWESLTVIGQHDFISWLQSAKQAETRAGRIVKMCDMIAKGKRRPCCYSVVPLGLHRALENSPKAKSNWKALNSMEKREFLDWIAAVSGKENKIRIEKACKLIGDGKKCPK